MEKAKTIALCSGSYDPLTYGHLAVIKQASLLFDEVYVGIGVNQDKKSRRYDAEEMKKAMEQVFKDSGIDNATIIIYTSLTAVIAKEYGVTHFVRGLRNTTDYHYEETLAAINAELSDGIPTIYFRAGDLSLISSSMVVDLLNHHTNIAKYVPKPVLDLILKNKK